MADIISRATWGAQPPKSTTPMGGVNGWVTHWVGGTGLPVNPSVAFSCALMRSLQSAAFAGLHGDHYVDFEYNFAVDPCGRILEGRGWDFESGANGANWNPHEWSVVYLAGPGVPLTDVAKAALLWLTQEGARRDGRCTAVRAHGRLPGDSTGCPGPDLTPYSDVLNAHLRDVTPPVAPKVRAEYVPAIVVPPIISSLAAPKGAWLLANDGSVWSFGGAVYYGAVNGKPYFAGRTPARIELPNDGEAAHGKKYTVIASSGERYAFP